MANWNKYGSSGGRKTTAGFKRSISSPVIDLHAHMAIPAAAKLVRDRIGEALDKTTNWASAETKAINAGQFKDRLPNLTDLNVRLADMDAMGIDLQVICSSPTQCYYTLPDVGVAIEATRVVNDETAAFTARKPDRLLGLGSVTLQVPATAVEELRRCMGELGLKGVQILTMVGDKELSDPSLGPFWDEAEKLGAFILLHPIGSSEDPRMQRFYFNNVIGNPMETSIALQYLIFDGVLARHPRLKLMAAHGGGYLPFYPGRIDHAWAARSDTHGSLKEPPTTHLKRVLFDTMVFTREQLEFLVANYSSWNVVMGTDYPFDMAEYDPVELVESAYLTPAQKADVLGGNATRLLGL